MYGAHCLRSNRFSFLLLICFGAAACSGGDDGTGPDENGQGSFSATVSGAVSGSFSGFAWQSGTIVDASTNERGWVLYMATESSSGSSVYVVRLGERPGNGSYSLVDLTGSGEIGAGQFGGIATVAVGNSSVFAGFSSGGTLTITSSSDDRVRGSFNFTITGFDANTQQQVSATVSGTFNAVSSNFAFPGF